MRVTLLPHADDRMEEFGITVADVYRVVSDPDEGGEANLGRRYAQKQIGRRRVRVIYNQGAGEAVVVTVMLRRTEGGGS